MCIATKVVAMFRSVSSCCSSGSASACEEEEEFPMTSPKLSATATTQAACSSSGMEDSPPASERLKPQPFRRGPALHFQACVRGDIHELTKWVKSGGDANARDEQGFCLLHHATMHGREKCVELLLRQGARHDTVSIGGHTVLHLASANRHCDVVKRLVEAGARVNVRNAHGNTPLHSAAATGTVDVLLYLLSQSANPDLVNSVGETPDQVCGATPEAVHLVAEARRLKQARIAQRFALVKIHKLWNSGRAEPISGSKGGEAPKATTNQAESTARDTFAGRRVLHVQGERERQRESEEVARCQGAQQSRQGARSQGAHQAQASLESTVAGVAGLPQEVLRRIVSYCTL